MTYPHRQKTTCRQTALAVLMTLCLPVFLLPLLFTGTAFSHPLVDISHGYNSDVGIPINHLGVITTGKQTLKRADFFRRSFVQPYTLTAVLKAKRTLETDLNLLLDCFVIHSDKYSHQFLYSLLDIPPPSMLS